MALVPALDIRDPRYPGAFGTGSKDVETIPQNVELEQGLLGILLYDNDAFHRIEGLQPEHFFEPLNGFLFAEIAKDISANRVADPVLIHDRCAPHRAYQEVGGVQYLATLVDRAPTSSNAADYAEAIRDLAVRRELIRVAAEAAELARPGHSDLTGRELVEATEQQLFGIAESGRAQRGLQTFSHFAAGALEEAAAAYQRVGSLSGISTGLTDLDRRLGGLHASDLIIIAARPSMGKTALGVNIAFNVAKAYAYDLQPDGSHKTVAGGRVAFFSLEMSGEQLAMRVLAEVSGVPSDRIRRGDIQAHEFGRIRDASELIDSCPLMIDDTGGLSVSKLCTRARRMKRSGGLDLIVVDYVQLLTADGRRGREANRVQEVTEITMALKALAKELSVPIIALAQLSRQVENREDKKPQLADLRESGSIEQDADVVMFIYREAYYLGRAEPKPDSAEHATWADTMARVRHEADIIIGKQRHGPIGTVKLAFDEDLTKFSNLARPSHFGQGGIDFGQASDRFNYGNRDD